jgi:hypothetical protein
MDTSLTAKSLSRYYPWRFEQSEIAPNLLLMSKLLILIMIAYQYPIKLQDPYIPFIPALDYFHKIPGVYRGILLTGYLFSTIAIFCNVKIRTASIVLGIVVMLEQLASQPGFKNHVFVCGCFFILVGFTKKGEDYKFLFWQLALIYLGAFINKVLDPDWHSGAFMHNWLQNARENTPYIVVSQLLPEKWFAIFLSYSALASEGFLGILLFFKRYRKYTFWIILLFHTVLYSFTAFRFGHFYDDLVIILLIFISWPKGQIEMQIASKYTHFKGLHQWLDWDQKFEWQVSNTSRNQWLQLKTKDGEHFSNFNALRKLLIYTPSFFILLFTFDCGIKFLFDGQEHIKHMINMPIVWMLIAFFLPLLWAENESSTPSSITNN